MMVNRTTANNQRLIDVSTAWGAVIRDVISKLESKEVGTAQSKRRRSPYSEGIVGRSGAGHSLSVSPGAVDARRAAELPQRDNKRALQQSPLIEVFNQSGQ